MKKIVISLFIIVAASIQTAWAQKEGNTKENTTEKREKTESQAEKKARLANVRKEMSTARTNIKAGKDLDKTESSMRKLLEDSRNYSDVRIHRLLFDALKKQYDQVNEKAFLKQKYDTASIFQITQRMFIALHNLDSLVTCPDSLGQVNMKYRKDDAAVLAPYYNNLYSAGVFYLNHQKYKEAISCLDTYRQALYWPLFSGNELKTDSLHINHAGYLILVCGYHSKDYTASLKYRDEALSYEHKKEQALQYVTDIYASTKDTANYVKYLKEGVKYFPRSTYFVPRLIDYFCNSEDYSNALEVTNYALKADSTNLPVCIAQQTILLNLGKYDDCIRLGEQLIAGNDSLASVNYNIAISYYTKAQNMEKRTDLKVKERNKQIKNLYTKCRPFMERYRKLQPDDRDRWKPVLYTVYLELNMGKEFTEIENQ